MKKKVALILSILLPVQIILIRILAGYPHLVEEWYSNGIYPYTSALLRRGLGFLPFSLGDLLYAFLVILLLRWFYFRIKQRFRDPKQWILNAVAALSLIYACFNLFWGLNYYRLPLHKALNIESDYTTEELIELTKDLIATSNDIHFLITRNDSLKVEIPYDKTELLELSVAGYHNLEDDFSELDYNVSSLKRSLYSIPLTYMGFNGYLNPLTNEGQVNTQIVPYKIPTTASHEIGHQLGFAKENEANFLACLTTMNHEDPYFRYSGYTFALSYCLNELYKRDKALTEELLKTINFGILENYKEVREFWEQHRNPFEPLFMYTYNSFLVANNQPDGMRSYSYVVALLVNYHKSRGRM
ncbi:DUF3810 domain-containing protein [Salinimicrobium oceani]|uniref:DUF3810 domain-containing protein n=1 Tax=Salinimicrobium oceani TaxID=2722702 RepID=A0ABX1CWT6_9FLAO|nr:DUF3810 domain-containing protein [Salinimicrobium oceani]NJW51617.1 DUF3810 domain-containing protein [Salinimicrobium oceani]